MNLREFSAQMCLLNNLYVPGSLNLYFSIWQDVFFSRLIIYIRHNKIVFEQVLSVKLKPKRNHNQTKYSLLNSRHNMMLNLCIDSNC